MRLGEAVDLVKPTRRTSSGGPSRLTTCHTIAQLRATAQKRLPRSVFDYIEGGADEELTLAANQRELRGWEFRPRVLRDVSEVDLSVTLLARPQSLPFGLAPTGYSLLSHPDGESGAARAAARSGIPYCVSNVANTSVSDVSAAASSVAPDADVWTQLYLCRDREVSWRYLAQARAAGSRVLQISVDTAVSGNRTRDLRNGLTIPPNLGVRTLSDVARHPAYWTAALRGPAFGFANIAGTNSAMTIASMTDLFDPTVTWDDLAAVREHWAGPILLKGPVDAEDARRALDHGIDGFHLSNHGGRQLDRCISPLRLLPDVRAAIGDRTTVIVDPGIRHGADVVVALARGADACMLGRAYLYGLAVAGEVGVQRAIDIVAAELRRTMQLLGTRSIGELRESPQRLLSRREGMGR